MEQYLQQMLGGLAGPPAGDTREAGATPTAGGGVNGAAAQIRNSPIGMTALAQVDAIRQRPLPPEPAAMAPFQGGDQQPQQCDSRTYEQWVAAARAANMTLEDYLVQELGLGVELVKAIAMIGWAETRGLGIDAVTLVNQTVINRYLSGDATVTGGQYFAIKELLRNVQGFDANADLRDEDRQLITQLSASFDATVEANEDLVVVAPHTTAQNPETLLLQWLAGMGYSSPEVTTQATPREGSPRNFFDVSASTGEASATALAQPYQVQGFTNFGEFENWSITIEGGQAIMAQEAYRRTVRLLAGIQLCQPTLFFPADVYGAQFVEALGRAAANGNIFERNPDWDLLVAIDAERANAVPQEYLDAITSRGPLVSGVEITAYEWLIIQHSLLSEAQKIQVLSSMVLQPGVSTGSAILTWSGEYFEVDRSLLDQR